MVRRPTALRALAALVALVLGAGAAAGAQSVAVAAASSAGTVAVGLLQLDDDTSVEAATRLASQAARQGADVVVAPERWLEGAPGADPVVLWRHVASAAGVAVLGTFSDGDVGSAAVLVDPLGAILLNYSKPGAHDPDRPSPGNPPTALLATHAAGQVRVGVLLGADAGFVAPPRSAMLQGGDLVLHAGERGRGAANGTDRRVLYWAAGDNRIPVATAAAGGGSGLVSDQCYWASGGGDPADPRRSGPGTPFPDGPCAAPAPPGERVVMAVVNVTAGRQRWRSPGWDTPRDSSRRPFDYQPLCYPKPRDRVLRRAAALHAAHGSAGDGDDGSDRGAGPAPVVVRVALLQMRAAVAPHGTNPVPAAAAKAETFVRDAAARGVDVALMPELWSIGFAANSAHVMSHYSDADSAPWSYDGVLAWAESRDGPYITRFRALAKELGIAIAATFLERVTNDDGDTLPPRNSVALIDRRGEIVYVFSKVHPAWGGGDGTDPEGLTAAGRTFYSGNLDLGPGRGNVTACSNICFDREHPESARLCALAGAELLLMPTACGIPWPYVDKVAARALTNVVAVAMANYGNSTEQPWANGHSMAAGASGRVVALAPGDPADPSGNAGAEGVWVADLDIDEVRALRATARGRARTAPHLNPILCRLPVAEVYEKPECNEHRLWL